MEALAIPEGEHVWTLPVTEFPDLPRRSHELLVVEYAYATHRKDAMSAGSQMIGDARTLGLVFDADEGPGCARQIDDPLIIREQFRRIESRYHPIVIYIWV